MLVRPIQTRIFKEGENLLDFIDSYILALEEKSIVVITSKIVALAEGRTASIDDKERIIKEESDFVLKTKYTWLTIKDGVVLGAAGVDESNGNGKLILLPKNSFESAEAIRAHLVQKRGLHDVGVIISDSRSVAFRAGIIGRAIGYAGFKGMHDYRGEHDIFGRVLKVSRTNVADSLATAAVLAMGEGSEQQPLCVITDAPAQFVATIDQKELYVDIEDDVYRPLFDALK